MTKEVVLAYGAGSVMAIFFGVSFLVTRKGLSEIPPIVLISCRFGVAAVFLFILKMLKLIKIDYRGKPIGGVIMLSVFYPGISFLFETIGLQYVTSSQAGIMVSIMPIFVTLLGVIILKEIPAKIQVLFIILSVMGVVITVVFTRSEGNTGTFYGLILMLISVVGGSVNNVLSRRYSNHFTSIEITYSMIWIGAIAFTGIAMVQSLFDSSILVSYAKAFVMPEMVLVILELSIGTSVIAFFCMNYMLSKLRAVNAAVFINLATVISVAAGVFVAGEHLYWYQAVGGFFILLSVWGTSYYESKGTEKM